MRRLLAGSMLALGMLFLVTGCGDTSMKAGSSGAPKGPSVDSTHTSTSYDPQLVGPPEPPESKLVVRSETKTTSTLPPPPSTMAATTKSLYERLGGEPAITAVVDEFVARASANPKVNFSRKGTPAEWSATPDNVAKLKKRLVQFIGSVSGGPQKYEGKDMRTEHAGMGITDSEFNAAAADLAASLDKFKVPSKEKDELMVIVGATKAAIVEKKM